MVCRYGVAILLAIMLLVPLPCVQPFPTPLSSLQDPGDCPGGEAPVSGDMSGLVLPEGYPLEEHFVPTGDGYILGVYRIPFGQTQNSTTPAKLDFAKQGRTRQTGKPVVLLQHGLLDSSATWVINGPQESLAFLLADRGFDVWLANSRGNTFSKRHKTLSTCSTEFWEFSFDEMVSFDLPATVEYIMEVTGVEQISYVGHSQGTTIAFAALSTNQKLASHISMAVMLAPVTYLTHTNSNVMRWLADLDVASVFKLLGMKDFLPVLSVGSELFGRLCKEVPGPCRNILTMLCGYNPSNINNTRWPQYLAYTPAGTSVQNMVHWAQAIKLKDQTRLQEFDFGTKCWTGIHKQMACNQNKYGQKTPPIFDVRRMRVPVALFSGGQDSLSDEIDNRLLEAALDNDLIFFQHEEPSYEHLDFTWGANAHDLIYPHVMRLLEEHGVSTNTVRTIV